MSQETANGNDGPSRKRSHRTFSPEEKLKAIQRYEQISKKLNKTSEELGIASHSLSAWYKNQDKIIKAVKGECFQVLQQFHCLNFRIRSIYTWTEKRVNRHSTVRPN
jgi:transposase-like protein